MRSAECGIKNPKILAIISIFIFMLVFSAQASAEEKEFKKGCRGCHKEMIEKWDTAEIKHYPYREEKCESCHSLEHKKFTPLEVRAEGAASTSGGLLLTGFTAELDKPCLICHDLAAEKIKKAHFSSDFTGKNCFSCHYTHASDKKGMLKEWAHEPFVSGMCDMCHEINSEGKIKVKEDIKKVCLVCHSDLAGKEDKFVHPAYEMMECTECHDPHTSAYARLLKKGISEICFSCHGKEVAKKHPYDVSPSNKIILEKSNKIWFNYSNKLTCVSCHKPHTANQSFLLKESLENGRLCYSCHKK